MDLIIKEEYKRNYSQAIFELIRHSLANNVVTDDEVLELLWKEKNNELSSICYK